MKPILLFIVTLLCLAHVTVLKTVFAFEIPNKFTEKFGYNYKGTTWEVSKIASFELEDRQWGSG